MDKNEGLVSDAQAIRAKRLRQLLTQKQKDDIKKAFDYFVSRCVCVEWNYWNRDS